MQEYINSVGKGKVELANRGPAVAATEQIITMKRDCIYVFPCRHVES
jgi:hypothetical protein